MGLLLHELVSNCCKHAFPGLRSGEITIVIASRRDRTKLVVSDTGQGLPPGFDYRQTSSLGLSLVHGLVRQLRGTCGERQVAQAAVALVHGNGGVLSAQATTILGGPATV